VVEPVPDVLWHLLDFSGPLHTPSRDPSAHALFICQIGFHVGECILGFSVSQPGLSLDAIDPPSPGPSTSMTVDEFYGLCTQDTETPSRFVRNMNAMSMTFSPPTEQQPPSPEQAANR
jgi:hypothetical protein